MIYTKVNLEDKENINILSALASSIVKEYYDPIIGEEQNKYMLQRFQSVEAINNQLKEGYQYYIVKNENHENCGFIGFYKRNDELYLSKYYLHKDFRGMGIGKQLFSFIVDNAKSQNLNSVVLNVNKYNSTIEIYEKMGLKRIREEKNDIGNGYYMDDYVYEYIVK